MKGQDDMMRNVIIISMLFGCMLGCIPAAAQQSADDDPFIAVAIKVTASVQVRRSDKEELAPLKKDDRLYPGDRIICGDGGYASLVFADNAVELKLYPNSDLTLQGMRTPASIIKRMFLPIGKLLTKVLGGEMEVVTPTSVASVKGTEWWTLVESANLTQIIVIEGEVKVTHRETNETVVVEAGNTAVSTSTGELEVTPSDRSDIPDQSEEPDQGTLDVQFEDGSGDTKEIHIEFEK